MNASTLREWGAIATSVATTLIFLCLVVAVSFVQDQSLRHDLMTALVQTAIVNFTTVVGFWVGSSNSSQKKDDVIAKSPPVSPGP